jgi:beta-lactamase regulating signal transducer with metallopeptidase domain
MLIPWAIEALVASAILMVAVLLLRVPVRRAFGPDIAYALWALPALRLLLPPLPQSWREIAVAPVIRASEQITVYVIEPLGGGATAPVAHNPSLGPLLVLLWVAGAVAFIGWHSLAHVRFCRRMLASAARAEEIEGGVRVIETGAASGPLAFGIWRRYVAFPRDFTERYDPQERDLALAHELGHHARGDLIANWVALVVLALHWFNPIAWRAFRAFRADQEIANDARVLAGQNPMMRHTYACAIVKAAHGGSVSAACHLHTIDDLKGRLRMLTTSKTSRLRLVSGSAAIAVLTLGGLGLTASGTHAAERVRSSVETVTGVNFAALAPVATVAPVQSAPAVPEAPAAPSAPAMPPLPQTPPAPEAPSAPAAPPAPPAPVLGDDDHEVSTSISTTADGHVVTKRVKRVVIRDKGGKMMSITIPTPDIPEVAELNCPTSGDQKEMVRNDMRDGKHRIIICTNRIERAASEGAAVAANSRQIERNAYRTALNGLRTAQERLRANRSMSEEARKEASAAIGESIADMEENLAEAK